MAVSPPTELEELVKDLQADDNVAWTQVIRRYEGMLRSIARSYRLSSADVDDVVQTVWVRLHERTDQLREPNAIGGWLATTARRESIRMLRNRTREQPTDDVELLGGTEFERPDTLVLADERHAIFWRALGTLPTRQRRLMVLLLCEPQDYREVSATLNMPVGSIGPTRARSMVRLQDNDELRELQLASC